MAASLVDDKGGAAGWILKGLGSQRRAVSLRGVCFGGMLDDRGRDRRPRIRAC